MSSFVEILQLILTDAKEIKGLADDELIAHDYPATMVRWRLSPDTFYRLARLQTLKAREFERGAMPDISGIKQVVVETGKDTAEVMSRSIAVSEDSLRRVMLLEQLIVEIVREAIPAESENLGVEYFVGPSADVYFRPLAEHRFLD